MNQSQISERSRIRNHPERAVPDEAAEILAAGLVAHIGFVEDDLPYVIPMSYYYDSERPDRLYLHGSIRSRVMDTLASGAPVCVTVTLTDGLVYSRKAMNHSMNYRSVVLFGTACEVTGHDEKFALFDRMVRRYFPDRLMERDYTPPPAADLGVTTLVEVQVEEWNAKARRGGPTGPNDNKPDAPGTAGYTTFREF